MTGQPHEPAHADTGGYVRIFTVESVKKAGWSDGPHGVRQLHNRNGRRKSEDEEALGGEDLPALKVPGTYSAGTCEVVPAARCCSPIRIPVSATVGARSLGLPLTNTHEPAAFTAQNWSTLLHFLLICPSRPPAAKPVNSRRQGNTRGPFTSKHIIRYTTPSHHFSKLIPKDCRASPTLTLHL